jgi:putative Holliday junction resolvase
LTETPKPPPRPDLGPEDIPALLARGQRLMGLDLGEKTIGVAISDVEHSIASAVRTVPRKKFKEDWVELAGLIAKFDIGALVIGLPLNMDGSSGPRVQASRTYARNIREMSPIPVIFWDERLSTVAAERALIAADMSRKKRAAVIDATAAAFILQGLLDRLRAIAAAGRTRDETA